MLVYVSKIHMDLRQHSTKRRLGTLLSGKNMLRLCLLVYSSTVQVRCEVSRSMMVDSFWNTTVLPDLKSRKNKVG